MVLASVRHCWSARLTSFGYPPPAPDPAMPKSSVPVPVQSLRRAMMDADLNSLTFHNMAELFTTRSVPRSGPVFIHVDPEPRTVIVKLSYFPPEDQTTRDEVAAFFAAVSGWKPR